MSLIKTNRKLVLGSIILAMFAPAIEGTIVATAIPSIVADLGGFSLFSWVFSSFMLAQAVTIPIYGKLADLYGRKPVFTFGVLVFLTGSMLCGFAKTMNMLIFFRLIQGLGARAVQPIATTIVEDIFHSWARARGLFCAICEMGLDFLDEYPNWGACNCWNSVLQPA